MRVRPMRKDFPQDAPPGALLAMLEARVQADSTLAAEWAEAWREWPAAGADARVSERFREWFLLEREATALGAAPAAAWAPRELGDRDEDPWTRLLEAQFRVLRVDGGEDATACELSDLWSGQSFEQVTLPAGAAAATLLLGRLAPRGVRGAQLLPGWRGIIDLKLADTLAGDLARVRAEQPRARLSQRECELLLAPYFALEAAAAADPITAEADRLRRLEEFLQGAPHWSVERAMAVLEDGGAQELLDRVAFESSLPIEPLRLLLAEWTAAQTAEALRSHAPEPVAESKLRPETVARALAAYDHARATGTSLDVAWSDLQRALQLDQVESRSDEGLWEMDADPEPIGPEALPGLSFWMETWAWERQREGRPASESERTIANQFARFAESLREGELDASEIQARDLWSFFAASNGTADLELRLLETADLVNWLRREQGAFVIDDPADWSEADRGRLRASVEVNARLRKLSRPLAVTTRIAAVEPARVATEQGDWVEVSGLPPQTGAPVRRGDLVAGTWNAGAFHAAAWFPQPLTAAESSAEA